MQTLSNLTLQLGYKKSTHFHVKKIICFSFRVKNNLTHAKPHSPDPLTLKVKWSVPELSRDLKKKVNGKKMIQ
jgi:hypothetical protein